MAFLHGEVPSNADEALGSFSAYRNAAASLLDGAVLVCDSEEWDVSNWYDASSGKFTPQVAGIYRISGAIRWAANVTFNAQLLVYKNGAVWKAGPWFEQDIRGDYGAGVSALVSLNGSTDYVEVRVSQSEGTAQAIIPGAQHTYVQGELVGRR